LLGDLLDPEDWGKTLVNLGHIGVQSIQKYHRRENIGRITEFV
jgi:hypothetical protein